MDPKETNNTSISLILDRLSKTEFPNPTAQQAEKFITCLSWCFSEFKKITKKNKTDIKLEHTTDLNEYYSKFTPEELDTIGRSLGENICELFDATQKYGIKESDPIDEEYESVIAELKKIGW